MEKLPPKYLSCPDNCLHGHNLPGHFSTRTNVEESITPYENMFTPIPGLPDLKSCLVDDLHAHDPASSSPEPAGEKWCLNDKSCHYALLWTFWRQSTVADGNWAIFGTKLGFK